MNSNDFLHMNREQLIDIIAELTDRIQSQIVELESKNIEIESLKADLKFFRQYFFARKTEKSKISKDDRQLWLFNEIETHADDPEQKEGNDDVQDTEHSHSPKKRGKRKPLPATLLRKIRIIELPQEKRICACGTPLIVIGEEKSEKLVVIPAQVYVEVTIRKKYACPNCEGTEDPEHPTVRIPKMPEELLPKSIASASLVAQIIWDKFCNGLPLNRQSNIWTSLGIDISVSDMSRWAIAAADKCSSLYSLLIKKCVESHIINMDETPLLVMKEPNRTNEQKSYMWVMCGTSDCPSRIFHYDPSRGHQVAEKLLESFQGYLQTDGLAGYKIVGKRDGVEHVACLAHIRRKFKNVEKVAGKKHKNEVADIILEGIGKIYDIERTLRDELKTNSITKEDFLKQRKLEAEPVLKYLIELIHQKIPITPPTSLLGRALSYASKQWADMSRYLDSPDLTPDNNIAENAIRPFVVGRKNWLFAGSPHGAYASALFYSLIETAKCNGIDPRAYINYVLDNIVSATTPELLEDLLPWNCKNKL